MPGDIDLFLSHGGKALCALRLGIIWETLPVMNLGWVYRDGNVIQLPSLTAVIQKEAAWFVSTCPELGVASQGKTHREAHAMLAEAVEVWLETASAKEIKRLLKLGGTVQPLQLVHA